MYPFMQYGISQLSKLEDSINERWARKKTEKNNISKFSYFNVSGNFIQFTIRTGPWQIEKIKSNPNVLVFYLPGRSTSEKSKSVTPNQKNQFDGSRKEFNTAIDRLCEFTGKEI